MRFSVIFPRNSPPKYPVEFFDPMGLAGLSLADQNMIQHGPKEAKHVSRFTGVERWPVLVLVMSAVR